MTLRYWIYTLLLFVLPWSLQAQDKQEPPQDWHLLDLQADGYLGISLNKAYRELLQGRQGQPVIVAVIDGGIDTAHEDLRSRLWINVADSAATGLDADGNGYVNDRYGWNFIGNAQGENLHYDNLEVTRLLRELEPKYLSVLPSTPMSEEERREFEAFQKMITDYAAKVSRAQNGQVSYHLIKRMVDTMKVRMGKENPVKADFDRFEPQDDLEKQIRRLVRAELKKEPDFKKFYKQLEDGIEYFDNQIKYTLNKDYDSRWIVGDDYENSRERYYGNPDVTGPDAKHGTHVAGIIAADRSNNLGIQGIADQARIMAIRTVPVGDERDKDVANAIFYAVENGAKVINMSFGKAYVKDKQIVDEAVQFAMDNDVLLVHAAGNDGKDLDENPNYPNKFYVDSLGMIMGSADAWLTVGASRWEDNRDLVASFSNYGARSVDVFAPGVEIYSSMPGSTYERSEGTSMAAPVVSGLAALIRSYFPSLTAVEVKQIIMDSVTPISRRIRIQGPDGRNQRVRMNEISVSGGIVNAYQAVLLARERTAGR